MLCLIIIILLIVIIFAMFTTTREHFSTVEKDSKNYYMPRLYSENVYDYEDQLEYPNSYKPYEFYQKFNCYYPYDFEYGTGSW